MSPCFSPLIYLFALTGSLLPLTGQSTLYTLSLLYTLLYIEGYITLGARFLPLSYIGVVGGGERVFDLSNRGAAALEESKHLFIYTLLYSKKKAFLLSVHFPPLNVSPFWYVAQEVLAVLSLLGKRGLSLGAKYWRWQGRLRGAR